MAEPDLPGVPEEKPDDRRPLFAKAGAIIGDDRNIDLKRDIEHLKISYLR